MAVVASSVAFYPSIRGQRGFEDLVEELPDALKALAGLQAGVSITSPAGYLNGRVLSLLYPAVLLVFAIAVGARAVGSDEDAGTLELVLTQPISRRRLALERAAGVAVAVVALSTVGTASLVALSPPFGLLEGVAVGHLLLACAAAACFALLHAGVAFAAGCASGSRGSAIGIGAIVAVAGYVLNGLVLTTDVMRPARFVTPWHWYNGRNILVEGAGPDATLLPLAVATVVGMIGVAVFERRDLT